MRSDKNFPVKQREIIKVALELFLQKGYEDTKITDIMREAKLSKGGMYHYFKSKEEILDAVVRYTLEEERPFFEKKLRKADNVTDKMNVFISGEVLYPSEFHNDIVTLRKEQPNSIVKYRIKELNAEFAIPYLCEIIQFGIEEAVFHTDYPEEVSKFLYRNGEMIFYDVLEAHSLAELEMMAKTKASAFVEMMSRTLCVKEGEARRFMEILEKELIEQAKIRLE